jgi:hypothetical protein
MMRIFSNHLLVTPDPDGTWSDRNLKDALAAGRLYGAFEIMGYPVGFDYHAVAGETVYEMGSEVTLGQVELVVRRPSVRGLHPLLPKPVITLRILKAGADGWREVAASSEDITFVPVEPGAYRAEVRMLPLHLEIFFVDQAQRFLEEDRPWIYSNPIYVR